MPRAADVPASGYGSVLEASNAATKPAEEPARVDAPVPGAASNRPVIELVWFDPVRAPFLARQNPTWEEHLTPPPDIAPDDPRAPEEWAKADRADVAAVLTKATMIADVQGVVADAVSDDGLLDTPVVIVGGDLELGFDEAETLKLYLAAAGPLVGVDKKLKETVEAATEAAATPFGSLPDVASGWCQRIREAWVKAQARTLAPDYFEVNTRRLLLDQRKYARRELCNEAWIRCQIMPKGAPAPVPTYLPDALAKWLPLFHRFEARVLAEAVPQQDQTESSPVALRAVALARVLPNARRR
jgi:hypothetical protein